MITTKQLTTFACIALLSLPLATPVEAASKAPKSEIDKAIGRCVATVAIGALLGAAIGSSGRGNAGRGAVLGAAAGGVVCAVLLKVAKDKDALLQHQREAVALGGAQRTTFEGHDGPVTLITNTRDIESSAEASGTPLLCRYADSQVVLSDAQEANLGSQLYCRNDAGDWAIADPKTLGKS